MSSSVTTKPRAPPWACLAGDAHGDRALAPVAGQLDLLLEGAQAALPSLGKDGLKLGHGLDQRLADDRVRLEPQCTFDGGVGDGDEAGRVHADDAGRDAGKHRFGEPAAPVDEFAGRRQPIVLAPQLLGHLVEALAEMGEVAVALPGRDLGVGNCPKRPGRPR